MNKTQRKNKLILIKLDAEKQTDCKQAIKFRWAAVETERIGPHWGMRQSVLGEI